jgi:hypothetical protein
MRAMTLFLLIVLPAASFAQTAKKLNPTGSLFQAEETLRFTLKYDIAALQANKDSLRETGLPGTLMIDGKSLEVQVMPRGQGSFNCPQPQLKLNFEKALTSQTPFEGFEKVKLFTSGRCIETVSNPEIDKTVLANYLIYKFYEQVFPVHFKTRLVEISYVDVSGKIKDYTQTAFFLEPERHFEKRLHFKRLEQPEMTNLGPSIVEMIDPETASLVHGFEFFIGNFDYGIPGLYSHITQAAFNFEKNVQLYKDDQGKLIPIAYDFDFSRLNYTGAGCSVSMKFFIGGKYLMECTITELVALYKDDFSRFRYQKDVTDHFDALKKAFQQFRTRHEPELARLGSKYSSDLDTFLAAFEASIR